MLSLLLYRQVKASRQKVIHRAANIDALRYAGVLWTLFYVVPSRWRTLYLLALSYGFYATWSLPCLGLLILVTTVVYGAGLGISAYEDEGRKKLFLFGGVAGLVALIVAGVEEPAGTGGPFAPRRAMPPTLRR
jgi:hypothetical protein